MNFAVIIHTGDPPTRWIPLPLPPFKNNFKHWSLTLKTLLFLGFSISTALYRKTSLTIKGSVHLDLSLLGNKCNLELYKKIKKL